MAEDLARPLVDGLGVPAGLGLGAFIFASGFYGERESMFLLGRTSQALKGSAWVATKIVLSSIAVLVQMQLVAGVSAPLGFSAVENPYSPENGDYFTEGSQQSATVSDTLRRAVSANWRGAAAAGYQTSTQTLASCAQTLADNDAAMANLVDAQAKTVSHTQFNLGMFQDSLIIVLYVVYKLELSPDPGRHMIALAIALGVCPPFVVAGAGELSNCLENSVDAADQATDIDYSTVATAVRKVTADCVAALSGLTPQPPAPPAPSTLAWTGDAALQRIASSMPSDPAPGVAADSPQAAAPPVWERPFMPAPAVPGAAQRVAPPAEQAGRPARPAVPVLPVRVREVQDPEARPADSESERAPLDVAAATAEQEPPQAALAGR